MSDRDRTDLTLTAKIEAIHRRSRELYGAPNIHAELADDYGIRVGRKRVARLMRAAGLRGATLRRYIVTTQPDLQAQRAVDLVDRQFYTDGPDRLWVADITYVPTWSGFLYLAMVLDVYSRRVVGWAMETHLRTELILAALNMAITQRRPSEVIHHSDRTAIVPMGTDTAKLEQLRPVSFTLKSDATGTRQYGLIAEEVAKVYPELVIRDEKGRIDGVRYDELAPMLLNETRHQAAEIRDLKQQQLRTQQQMAELKALNQATQVALRTLQAKDQLVVQR